MHFPKGAEVITPACTFNTTVAPIVQAGLTPVFVDVNLGTYQIDVAEMKKHYRENSRGYGPASYWKFY